MQACTPTDLVERCFCEGLAGPNNKAAGETDLDLKGEIELSGSAEVGELIRD